jgi:farnesyl-diphosphate farnesyltransferase
LLTELFYHYYPDIGEACYEKLKAKASSFGIGLQLTNIIKDSVIDYQRGWCYLPSDLLEKFGLSGEAFLDINKRKDAFALMNEIINKAKKHLEDAIEYTCLLPRSMWSVRIFCFLPILMAVKTLSKAVNNEALFDAQNPVKISRAEVKKIIFYTFWNCWSNKRMKKWNENLLICSNHKHED